MEYPLLSFEVCMNDDCMDISLVMFFFVNPNVWVKMGSDFIFTANIQYIILN